MASRMRTRRTRTSQRSRIEHVCTAATSSISPRWAPRSPPRGPTRSCTSPRRPCRRWRPANVYAATKVASEALVHEFAGRRAAATTLLRPANQIGPRQHPGIAASAFAKQIAEAEAGLAEPVVIHGLLDPRRDFLDVRDMAAAYA